MALKNIILFHFPTSHSRPWKYVFCMPDPDRLQLSRQLAIKTEEDEADSPCKVQNRSSENTNVSRGLNADSLAMIHWLQTPDVEMIEAVETITKSISAV